MNEKRIMLCLLAVLLLAGCVSPSELAPPLPPSTATPPPIIPAEDSTFTTTLFFLTAADKNLIRSEEREITVTQGQNRAEAVMQAWLQGPVDSTLEAALSKDMDIKYKRLEISGDVCLLYFTGEPYYEEPFLRARAALAATMQAAVGCRYTDLYVDNVKITNTISINNIQMGSKNRPLGALKMPDTGINTVNVVSLQKPPDASEDPSEMVLDNRDAILYYTDSRQTMLGCAVKALSYKNDTSVNDLLAMLITALTAAPQDNTGFLPAVPADLTYSSSTFRRLSYDDIVAQGDTAVPEEEPSFFSDMPEWGRLSIYLETAQPDAVDQRLMCAAIINTITGFIPKVMSLRIFLNRELLQPETLLDATAWQRKRLQAEAIPDQFAWAKDTSAFTRTDFSGMLGHTVQLHYPESNGMGLNNVSRIVPQESIYDPRIYLQELLSGITWAERPLSPLSPEDILSVTVWDSLAVANMRAGFFDKLNALANDNLVPSRPVASARLSVFSIVNTLCGVAGVERVQVLEEGERIEKSLGKEEDLERIYLGNALFYNPGIMLPVR